MRVTYESVSDLDAVLARIRALEPRTVVLDVEPMVAYWDTDQASLASGVAAVLERIGETIAGVGVVVFATNSLRRPATDPAYPGLDVRYLYAAGKPLRTGPYRRLPRPGVVVGDQVATDGVLAWRLGYAFLHYRPALVRVPPGPRIMRLIGRPLWPVLFTRSGAPRAG